MSRFPLADWSVEQLRLTAFPMPGATTRVAAWWDSVTGVPPDETTSKRNSTVISGPFGPGKLILGLEADRIDWLVLPPDIDLEVLEPEFPNAGPFVETLGTFSGVAENWLGRDDLPDLGRLAFGAVLKHTEDDLRCGYVRIHDYVPIQVDPEASSDFLFQINLPIASRTGIAGLQINRLSKWSVSAFRSFAVKVPGLAGIPQSTVQDPLYAFRLELDINTAPGIEGLPRQHLIDVYRELVQFGREIAADGLVSQ
jgi:hypothetical protein